jgi:hypothetical protein
LFTSRISSFLLVALFASLQPAHALNLGILPIPAKLWAGYAVGSPSQSQPQDSLPSNYNLKLSYGKTFGTCTRLDYTTLEMSRRMTQYTVPAFLGQATGELQVALLASHVGYNEGKVEKIKRLDFRDGYEVGWMPKNRITFSSIPFGFVPFMEGGAGLGYVSETYRNSGSRWNWSLMSGMGFERGMGSGSMSFGVQWRHLSNGNMWGKGDELHNSNSGTDMLQALAVLSHSF